MIKNVRDEIPQFNITSILYSNFFFFLPFEISYNLPPDIFYFSLLKHEYFITQINPKEAPVIIWLQGGPGDTSLFGLFLENGPFGVAAKGRLKPRKYSWSANHNVIYIDNPVGSGWSFTEHAEGNARNESAVAGNLKEAVRQFFALFPEIRGNELYVCGESYAGKYVPALSRAIADGNSRGDRPKIGLAGVAIGNGWIDPVHQLDYGDYLYQLGLLDLNGRVEIQALEREAKDLMCRDEYALAGLALARMATKFKQLTGLEAYFDYLEGTKVVDDGPSFASWIQGEGARRAIHVGNSTFHTDKAKVAGYLAADVAQSAAPAVADLLERGYRVLLYSGQLDIVCAYPMLEGFLRNLNWTGAAVYEKAPRRQWWVAQNQLAGYSKSAANLTEVLVRNAGHAAPIDQGFWVWEMITRFTRHQSF
ncbi:venom serine carboxypeptidase-like [Copidosoma floridanum]|uniref:venom serine carboxypeptidase-like n=1 Tax=Copidosoma floridanum TaxID=29053 RepID=UPI0006C9B60C|nr:venom serine carboxypeptidase-like [Copidosoma floridanum]